MLNLRDKIMRGIIALFLIAALCAGVAHLVNNPRQPEEVGGHYQLNLAIVMADNTVDSSGAGYGLHLNTGRHSSPLYDCDHYIQTSQDGRETSLPLSFLCELLC